MSYTSSPHTPPVDGAMSDVTKLPPKAWRSALDDILKGFEKWDVWLILGWQDIRLRYRRSTLGPFWITLSMGVTIFGMAFLYGYLFKMNTRAYFPYLACSMIIWGYFSTLCIEGTQVFLESSSYLKQIKQPFTVFVLRVMVRNSIVFAHNLLIMIPVVIYFQLPITWHLLLFIPALCLIFLAAFAYVFILAIFGTRFRDVTQIVTSVVQVVFFITPIMWTASLLGDAHQYIVTFNPFAHFLEILRAPWLGHAPALLSVIVCLAITGVGLLLSFLLLVRVRKRIIYWL